MPPASAAPFGAGFFPLSRSDRVAMIAPARNISLAVIGCQGLDVLHLMRLKVACSLLMADYIQADVQEWKAQSVDVLVASADDPQGREALRAAGNSGMPVLAITRDLLSGLSVPGVAYGASVREIFQQLRQVLIDSGTDAGQIKPRTLFNSLEQAQGKACVLDMGLMRVLIDARRSQLLLLRELPHEQYLRAAGESGWTLSVLADDAEFDAYRAEAASRHAYEDFCWQAAAMAKDALVAVAEQGRYSLRAWPELQAGGVPAAWLLPMSALLLRPWQPAELASATGASLADVLRILAAARFTGLLLEGTDHAGKSQSKAAGVTAMFSRIAKRFGLHFRKKVQG